MALYTDEAWQRARQKIYNELRPPVVEIVTYVYGPPATGKTTIMREFEKNIQALGFKTLIRTEVPISGLPCNEIYGVKSGLQIPVISRKPLRRPVKNYHEW